MTRRNGWNWHFLGAALAMGGLLALNNCVLAASGTWTGATSTAYLTAGNWVGGNVPTGVTDVGTFQAGAIRTSVVLPGSTVAIDGFTFNAGAPVFGFTLGAGSDLRFLGQGLVNNAASTQAFSIGSGATLSFLNSATASLTSLATNSGGNVFFQDTASGGQATFVTNAGGTVNFSGLTSIGTTAGSLAGAGNYVLGSKSLETGANNTSTAISGVISGVGGSLRKVGTGTFTLSGVNTYTGGTTLSAGTLAAGNDSAFGTGPLTINGGALQASGTRSLSNNVAVGNDFTISGSGTSILTLSGAIDLGAATRIISVSSTGTTTLAGIVSNGSLTKAGTGTLTLSGANTYTDTTVSAGTLRAIGGNDRLSTTGSTTISTGATINLSSTNQTFAQLNGGGSLINIGSLTIGTGTFSGQITGGGSLTKNTASSLTLSGANTYAGGTTLSAGTLVAGSNTAFGTGALTLNGGTLQASGTRTLTNSVNVGSDFNIGGGATDNLTMSGAVNLGGVARTLTVTGAGSTTLSGVISNGSLTKAGAGSLILSGANTYAGGATLSAGTLAAGNNSALGSGALTINGGTLQASGTRTLTNNVNVGSDFNIGGGATDNLTMSGAVNLGGVARTLTVTGAGSTTLSGVISNGSLTKAGTGSLILSGANTYAGGATLFAGTLAAGNDSALGSGALTLNGGTLQASGAARTLSNNVAVGNDFTIGGTLNLTLSGGVDLGGVNRTFTVTNTGATTLSGVISNGSLTKVGTGSLILSGANTYTGGTTLSAGTLVAGSDTALGIGTLTINNGTTLQASGSRTLGNSVAVGGNFTIAGGATSNLTLGGAVDLGGADRTLTVSSTGITNLSGVISNGSLTKAGAGSLTLSGANTYAGGTTLSTGTLIAGADTALGSGTLTINGGTLQASGSRILGNSVAVGGNFTIAGGATTNLTLGGAVDLGGAGRTLTVSSTGTTNLSGVISNGSLTKAGTGSLTLSGANIYAGGTTLSTGTLVAGSNTAFGTGALTLNGGTLQASGTRVLTNSVAVGGNFTIGGGATDNLTLGGGVDLGGANRSITVNSLGITDFSGVISNGSLTKAGTRSLILSGANTYTGGTTLSAGTLVAGSDTAFGIGTLTINNGTTLQASGSRSLGNNVTVGGNFTIGGGAIDNLTLSGAVELGGVTRTVTVNSAGSTTLSGVISNGSLTKAGTGSLTLSGTNIYTNTTLSAGTLVAGSDSALGTGTLTINNGTTLQAIGSRSLGNNVAVGGNFTIAGGATDNLTLDGAVNLGGATRTITVNSAGDTTLAGVISNGSLTKAGTGSLTLSGANIYTNTTLSAGTLVAGNDSALGIGTLTINNGTTLQASGSRSLGNNVAVGGNFTIGGAATDNLTLDGAVNLGGTTRTITVNSAGDTTLAGVISNGSLTKAGAGSLTLSGANIYTNTTLSAGTLVAGSNTAFGTGTLTINGGTLQASGSRSLSNIVRVGGNFTIAGASTDNLTLGGAVNLNGAIRTITVNSTGDTILAGVISNGSLAKAGAGTLTLSGANTYTGGTTLSAGTLVAGSNTAFGTGILTLNGGTLQASGSRSLSNNVTVGGNFAIGGGATDNLTLGGAVNLGGDTRTLTVSSAGSTTLAGVISNGSLTKAGTGNLTLSGANTYAGGTTLSAGTLVAGNDSAFGTGILTINGGTLQASGSRSLSNNVTMGGNVTIGGGATDNLTLGGAVNLGGATRTIAVNSAGSTTLSGVISNGSLTKAGAGSLTLSGGANTYTDTTVSTGTLRASGGSNRLSTIGITTISAGATIDLSGNDQTFAILNGGGNLINIGSTIINAGTFSGSISGIGSLTKASPGSLTLSGANSYAGGTTINDGLVIVTSDANLGDPAGFLTFNGGSLKLADNFTTARTINLSAGGGIFDLGGYTCTLHGPLAGNGAFLQQGQGRLTMEGDSLGFTGTYTVNSGNLNMGSGGRLGGTLVINSGASLSGAGIVTNVSNKGTVSPGTYVGTLSVVGNFTQTACGTLEVEITSPASFDKLSVTGIPGTANLNGTLQPLLRGGYVPRRNQLFPGVLTATGGISGTFSTVGNQQLTHTLFWKPIYHPNSIDLTVFSDYTNAGLGLNSNQWSVGNMLNRAATNANVDLNTLLDAIDNLPSAQTVRDAYTQIGPEKTGAIGALALLNGNNLMRNLSRRVNNLRYLGPEMATAVGWRSPLSFSASKQKLMLAYDADSLSGLITGTKEKALDKSWGLWIDPMGTVGHLNTTINQTGYDFSIAGFTAGIDYRVRENLLMGLATGYTYTSARFKSSGGTITNNTWPLMGYVAYLPESFYAFGSTGYCLNGFDLERKIHIGGLARTAKSSPVGNQFNAYAEVGYKLKMKPWVVTPAMSLSYSQIWLDSFTEKGADSLNLRVKAQNAKSLQTGVGGKVSVPLKRGSVTVVPQVYAFYQHEFSNNTRGLDARLSQGSSTCTWQTDKPQRDYAVVGGDVTLSFREYMSAYVNYSAEVGRGNNTTHYINAGLRWKF